MFPDQGRKEEHVSLRYKNPRNAAKMERLQTLHRSISATKHRPASLLQTVPTKDAVSLRRKSKLVNQTVLTPTPNFSAIGDQTADYELIDTFNQSLSNSIMNPVETESLKKQSKQVSFQKPHSALTVRDEAKHQRSRSTSRDLSAKRKRDLAAKYDQLTERSRSRTPGRSQLPNSQSITSSKRPTPTNPSESFFNEFTPASQSHRQSHYLGQSLGLQKSPFRSSADSFSLSRSPSKFSQSRSRTRQTQDAHDAREARE